MTRSALPPDSQELAGLGFLNEPGVTAETVLARLGAPSRSFEDGRIVSYTVYYNREHKQLSDVRRLPSDCYALMIEYGAGRVVARHTLVRDGALRCREPS